MKIKSKKTSFPGGFSVLMSVYKKDNPIFLSRAIESVLANTLLPNQFLIVIDGPLGKKSKHILLDAKKNCSFVELLFLSKNVGLALALNEGIKKINFPWVVRADADDFNFKNRFSVLAREINHNPNLDLLGSVIVEIDQLTSVLRFKMVPLSHREIKTYIKYRNPFNHMSVAFKLDKVKKVGGYPNIYLKEDYGLWALMIREKMNIKNISDVLVKVEAGHNLYARRGGLRYARSEIQLQFFLYKSGLQSVLMAFLMGLVRSTVFLLPNWLRAYIYKYILRVNNH